MAELLQGSGGAVGVGVGVITAATAAAAAYYISSRPEPNILPPFDLEDQSIILEVCLKIHSSLGIVYKVLQIFPLEHPIIIKW